MRPSRLVNSDGFFSVFLEMSAADPSLKMLLAMMVAVVGVGVFVAYLERRRLSGRGKETKAAFEDIPGDSNDVQLSSVMEKSHGLIREWLFDPSTKQQARTVVVAITAWWLWREFYWAFISSYLHAAVANDITSIHEHKDIHKVYTSMRNSLCVESLIGLPCFFILDPLVHQYSKVGFRNFLTQKALEGYLKGGGQAYYHVKLNENNNGIDNPDQRIVEDVANVSTLVVDLYASILSTLFGVSFWSFAIFGIGGSSILQISITFALLRATVAFFGFGRQLVVVRQEVLLRGADFRYGLTRIRDSAEEIALGGGDGREYKHSEEVYGRLMDATWEQFWATTRYGVSIGLLDKVPGSLLWLALLPLLIRGQIQFGDALRVHLAYDQASKLFGFLANNFGVLTDLQANLDRLLSLLDACDAPNFDVQAVNPGRPALGTISMQDAPAGMALVLEHLTVQPPRFKLPASPQFSPKPNGLSHGISLSCACGESMLILGPSGVGKTSILRAVARLWTHGSGVIKRGESVHFLPSKCYVPRGTLLQAISYPKDVDQKESSCLSAKIAKQALLRARLGHIQDKWGIETPRDWRAVLSTGELQRLAFARLFFHLEGLASSSSTLAVLDEATSGVDVETEEQLYTELRQELEEGGRLRGFISVAHRPQLTRFHDSLLIIGDDEGIGEIEERDMPTVVSGSWTAPGGSTMPWRQVRSQSAKTAVSEIIAVI